MIETIKTIQELMTLKVKIIVTTQGLTFDDSPYSIFLIQLFAALAELESNHASERIKAGLQVARAKGKSLGRRVAFAEMFHHNLIQAIQQKRGRDDDNILRFLIDFQCQRRWWNRPVQRYGSIAVHCKSRSFVNNRVATVPP